MLIVVLIALSAGIVTGESTRRIESRAHGFEIRCPTAFREVPVKPDTTLFVGRFMTVGKLAGLEMSVVSAPDVTVSEVLDRLRGSYLSGWVIVTPKSATPRSDGRIRARFAAPRGDWMAAVFLRPVDGRVLGLVGLARHIKSDLEPYAAIAKTLEPRDIDSRVAERWRTFYARNPRYRQPDLRVEHRLLLADGWNCVDTENFLILYSTRDVALISRARKRLEVLLREFKRRFPPDREVPVSVVRICKDPEEYLSYGGRDVPGSWSVGYFDSAAGELVLYDHEIARDGGHGNRDTFLSLYHEAFHQYMHQCMKRVPAHVWFEEGYADYVAGAVIHGDRFRYVQPHPWRLAEIKRALAEGESVSLAWLFALDRETFYEAGQVAYAHAWAFVYFLQESDAAQDNPRWRSLLDRYHEACRPDGEASAGSIRARALEGIFEPGEREHLESAWRVFLRGF